jgi:hypothetical protein
MMETVQEVLQAIGWDVGHRDGRHWRTRCPIHRGDNTTAFSYRDNIWKCFAGCGGGGIKQLQEAVGLDTKPLKPPKGFHGVLGMDFDWKQFAKPKVSARLAERWREIVRLRKQEVEERHRVSLCMLRDLDELFVQLGQEVAAYSDEMWPTELEHRFSQYGRAKIEAMDQLRRTHAEMVVLAWAARLNGGYEPCPGGCYSGGDDPRCSSTVAEVYAWVRTQDQEFQQMVEQFLAEADGMR